METIDIIMLIGLLLMITALVLMYRCARKRSPCRKMEELAEALVSVKRILHTNYSDSITCWK